MWLERGIMLIKNVDLFPSDVADLFVCVATHRYVMPIQISVKRNGQHCNALRNRIFQKSPTPRRLILCACKSSELLNHKAFWSTMYVDFSIVKSIP